MAYKHDLIRVQTEILSKIQNRAKLQMGRFGVFFVCY